MEPVFIASAKLVHIAMETTVLLVQDCAYYVILRLYAQFES